MAKKEDLTAELHRLESEIESYGTAVSDAQIWHKKARIEQIKKELAEMTHFPEKDLAEKIKCLILWA